MAIAAWQEWPWWEYAFLSDGSPVSWLSSALLAAGAAVALNLTVARRLRGVVGILLPPALAVLVLDEQFQGHERLKEAVGPGALATIPMIAVGIGGVFFLVAVLKQMLRPARIKPSLRAV